MNVHVFLGPSVPIEDARSILDATYRPPVVMGDVYRAVRDGAEAIGIIDGLFEQIPSVFHKEVLFALEQGVTVWGASSMGALRAAELEAFGMRGVGKIFERYRDGIYEDDDEVAVAHAPASEGHRAISEAMVNIRETIARATEAGAVAPVHADQFIAIAKSAYYPERCWPMVWDAAKRGGMPVAVVDAARDYVRTHAVNLKRLDACELLTRLAEAPVQENPAVRLERTIFWHRLVDDRERTNSALEADSSASTQEELRSFALVHSTRRRDLLRMALLDMISEAEARRAGLRVELSDLQASADRFRREHGLISAADLHQWLADNALSVEQFNELIRIEALLDGLVMYHGRTLQGRVLDVIRRQGRFHELRRNHDRKLAHLARLGVQRPTLEHAGVPLEGVLRWYAQRFGPLCGAPADEAKLLGFETQLDFVTEVVGTYLADRAVEA
jgi:hypothetical protein